MDEREDMQDYWNEYKLLPRLQPEEEHGARSSEECELETEWLQDVGLDVLTAPFKEGRELAPDEVNNFVQHFSPSQAEAVRRRVKTLNDTVRQRKNRSKYRKADVRDVFRDFKDVESRNQSQNTASDSLDSGQFTTTIHVSDESMQQRRRLLARTPSHPLDSHELFRKYLPDIAGSGGLQLVRYDKIGTFPRHRSGSDPLSLDEATITEESNLCNVSRLSRSHGNLLDEMESLRSSSLGECDRTWIDSLDPSDVEQLKPLFLAEATTIMDSYCPQTYKRKPLRLSRKSEGNVFGVPLGVLLEKDERAFKENDGNHPFVPALLQLLINNLEKNHLLEEGLLRVAGVKTRIDSLTQMIETNFYINKQSVQQRLFTVSPHDVTAALKKFLRELPEPLLTYKLIYKFYSSHAIANLEKQRTVLNLLILQLPREHQATLRYLFRFFRNMAEYETHNKMGIHSVATILAPSLFPPRCIAHSKNDVMSQVELAERCIVLTETLLNAGESLWIVPNLLIRQLRNRNKKENNKPSIFRQSKKDSIKNNESIVIQAPQFNLPQFQISVSNTLTAGDVVLEAIKEGMVQHESSLRELLPRGRVKPLAELSRPGMALSCFLSAASSETVLQTHFLFEHGGNIVQRELEHSALVSTVLRDNPGAQWRLECRHRNCHVKK